MLALITLGVIPIYQIPTWKNSTTETNAEKKKIRLLWLHLLFNTIKKQTNLAMAINMYDLATIINNFNLFSFSAKKKKKLSKSLNYCSFQTRLSTGVGGGGGGGGGGGEICFFKYFFASKFPLVPTLLTISVQVRVAWTENTCDWNVLWLTRSESVNAPMAQTVLGVGEFSLNHKCIHAYTVKSLWTARS